MRAPALSQEKGRSFIFFQTLSRSMSEIIFGIHAVQALLERDPQRFQEVFDPYNLWLPRWKLRVL